jgi:hypothetical protein
VESSCESGNEPSGSIKCWELPNGCTTCGLSSDTQLHRVGWLVSSQALEVSVVSRPSQFEACFHASGCPLL